MYQQTHPFQAVDRCDIARRPYYGKLDVLSSSTGPHILYYCVVQGTHACTGTATHSHFALLRYCNIHPAFNHHHLAVTCNPASLKVKTWMTVSANNVLLCCDHWRGIPTPCRATQCKAIQKQQLAATVIAAMLQSYYMTNKLLTALPPNTLIQSREFRILQNTTSGC